MGKKVKLAWWGAFAAAQVASAQEGTNLVARLQSLSLAELLNTEVTSVLRKPGTVLDSPSAVYVITGEDLRRSGVRSLADALRMAPGINVAHLNQNAWEVRARGPSGAGRFTRTMQVLIDGRSVYSTVFGDAYWDTVDYVFEDIDHIEVIRGPGGASWGANAVDGVINVVTKNASDTQGGYVSAGGGNVEQGFAEGRFGGALSKTGSVRGYAKYFNRADAGDGADGWDYVQAGFRADWALPDDRVTVSGDFYHGDLSTRRLYPRYDTVPRTDKVLDEFGAFGGNALLAWTHDLGPDSDLRLQAAYTRMERDGAIPDDLTEEHYDVEVQHRLPLPLHQDFQYGFGYRYFPSTVSNRGDTNTIFLPQTRHEQLFTSFAQDELRLFDDHVRLVGGVRVEHWDATGWEVLPNFRVSWLPTKVQTVWAAVSYSVAIPDRAQRDPRISPLTEAFYLPGVPAPAFITATGVPGFESNKLIAYELGHRWLVTERVSLDTAVFFNDYDDVTTGIVRFDQGQFVPTPIPHLEIPSLATNLAQAKTYGAEVAASWQAASNWRLSAVYSLLCTDADDPFNLIQSDAAPKNQIGLRSYLDLPHNFEVDIMPKYVDSRSDLGVPAYWDLDVHLGWRPSRHWEFSIVGQNLFDNCRMETVNPPFFATEATPVVRACYGQVTYRF